MAWSPLAGVSVATAGLVAAFRPWDGHALSLNAARVTAALVAAGIAFALDDDAAVTLAPLPTSLRCRLAVRLALASAAAASVTAGTLAVAAVVAGANGVPVDRLVLEGTGLLLLAMALSVALGADRGVFVFAGTLLGTLVAQQRWPSWALFPPAAGAPGWWRAGAAWAVIAVLSAGTLVLLSRDPARCAGLRTRRDRSVLTDLPPGAVGSRGTA